MAKVLFKTGTQSEYDALLAAGKIDENALYFVSDTQKYYKGGSLFGIGLAATQSAIGLLSEEDKVKLDSLVSNAAHKVSDAITGNLVALNSEGDLVDSQISASDISGSSLRVVSNDSDQYGKFGIVIKDADDGFAKSFVVKGNTLLIVQYVEATGENYTFIIDEGNIYLSHIYDDELGVYVNTIHTSVGESITANFNDGDRFYDLTKAGFSIEETSSKDNFEKACIKKYGFTFPFIDYTSMINTDFNFGSLKIVGRNLLDHSRINTEPVETGDEPWNVAVTLFPNTEYYIYNSLIDDITCQWGDIYGEDIGDSFIINGSTMVESPKDAYTLFMSGVNYYNNSLAINISDPNFNGKYEEYYAFDIGYDDSPVNYNLYGVGEIQDEFNVTTGKFIRRCAIREYEEGDEDNPDAITDFNNTVYIKDNPEIYTIEDGMRPQSIPLNVGCTEIFGDGFIGDFTIEYYVNQPSQISIIDAKDYYLYGEYYQLPEYWIDHILSKKLIGTVKFRGQAFLLALTEDASTYLYNLGPSIEAESLFSVQKISLSYSSYAAPGMYNIDYSRASDITLLPVGIHTITINSNGGSFTGEDLILVHKYITRCGYGLQFKDATRNIIYRYVGQIPGSTYRNFTYYLFKSANNKTVIVRIDSYGTIIDYYTNPLEITIPNTSSSGTISLDVRTAAYAMIHFPELFTFYYQDGDVTIRLMPVHTTNSNSNQYYSASYISAAGVPRIINATITIDYPSTTDTYLRYTINKTSLVASEN